MKPLLTEPEILRRLRAGDCPRQNGAFHRLYFADGATASYYTMKKMADRQIVVAGETVSSRWTLAGCGNCGKPKIDHTLQDAASCLGLVAESRIFTGGGEVQDDSAGDAPVVVQLPRLRGPRRR